jgi:acyl-CoA synthetase (AMP-forming)/AMP-acid ligase II
VLAELLRAGAASAPDQPLVASATRTVSWGEAFERCRVLASGLRERSIDRFGCVIADAADLVTLLCASSAVGAEACVYPASDPSALGALAAAFDHRTVVGDDAATTAVDVLPLASLADAGTGGDLPPTPERCPVLILTTGTTGERKGVRHDWRRLVAATKHPDEAPGARWLLAYNLHQFAGTQMLLHVLASRATFVVPPSNQPKDALRAMRDLGVTHASATPTFWRFALALLGDQPTDSLALTQITLGGEAVPSGVLRDLERAFPRARVSQVYAATEFGSGVSVRDGEPGLPASVLDRGDDADVQLRIVEGQLEVRSSLGMLGYYGEADVDGWRPTGDLVEVRGDRIHFVGRSSERINVGGVKVHPLPIEDAVSTVPGVEIVRAYGRPNPLTGQIVALDVVARQGADHDEVRDAILAACDALPAAARPRRIRFVDELDVRGHKIARGAAVPSAT